MAVGKRLILSTIAISLFFTVGYTANERLDPATLKAHYGVFIDELISQCEYKEAEMVDSKLKSIRRAAALACLKAAFFKTHKETLIGKLISKEIGIKSYKIQYYLNREFFAVLRIATNPER